MQATEFVTSYFDAWNRQDARAIAEHLHEKGTYLDIPVHQQMSREELVAHLDDLFQRELHRYELLGEVCVGENTIAFQYKVLPRDDDNTADEEAWYGAEFMTVRAGAALAITDYYDQPGSQSPSSPLASAGRSDDVQRYAKSGLGAPQLESMKQQLVDLMTEEKLHLRADLTLPELAEVLGCTVNHLSQVINAGFGMSFFDYINQYRVEAAKLLLSDEQSESRTVLNVALDVGFNSTSTFYVAFKKLTGQTPAQYRKEHRGNSGGSA